MNEHTQSQSSIKQREVNIILTVYECKNILNMHGDTMIQSCDELFTKIPWYVKKNPTIHVCCPHGLKLMKGMKAKTWFEFQILYSLM